ncbi:MAG TPA: glycosyl transferase family 2, partial [Thermoanaerobaculia bacterium]
VGAASVRYDGISGKGSAFRAVFEAAVRLGARAVVVLDADLRSVTPQWIVRLAGPIIEDRADYVTPLYHRHKFDGTITNSIVYPLTSALYGGNIRQPIGGDFGFSGALASLYLARDVWETDVARFGIDLWMTITALAERYRIAQAHLGAKVHDPKDPAASLAGMLVQVVGTAFTLMETYHDAWTTRSGALDAPVLGEPLPAEITPVEVNLQRMDEAFRRGVENLETIYRQFLPPDVVDALCRAAFSPSLAGYDDPTWAHTIVHFADAHRRRALPREQLLGTLTPLYLGRTASFVRRNENSSIDEVERRIDELRLAYHDHLPELRALWGPAPLRP